MPNIPDIKSFEDACKALNINEALPDVSSWPPDLQQAMLAEYKLMIITRALNEGWELDWKNKNQLKYYPWFYTSGSGRACIVYGCTNTAANTSVGSRLCFKSSQLAEYAGKTFTDLYSQYFLNKQQ